MATSTLTPPLTEKEINAPAGMSTADGGVMSGHNPLIKGAEAPPQQPDPVPELAPKAPNIQLEPQIQSPTTISSNSMRDQLSKAEQDLLALKKQLEAPAPVQPTTEVPNQTPVTDTKQPVDPNLAFIDDYTRETNKILRDRERQFDKYLNRSDGILKSQVNSLKANFDLRRQQAEKVAANAKAASTILGSRTGRQRYAPEIQQGILTGQENALITTLSEIDAMELEAIAEAEAASFDRDYETFIDKIDSLDTIKQARENTLSELQEAMQEENTRRQEQADALEQESKIIEQFSAGLTDPIQIFTALQGTVPYDMIVEYAGTLPQEQASPEPIKLGSADLLINPQTGEVIARGSKVGGGGGFSGGGSVGNAVGYGVSPVTVGSPSVGGLGTTYDQSSVEAQLQIDDIVNGLPTQLINNVAEIPRWREAVRKQLQAGYTPQQVIDKLSGFRLFDGADKSLGGTFYNMMTGTDLAPQDLSSLMNRGAVEQAMTTVENAQLNNVKAFFAPVDKARATVKQADTVLNILNDPSFPKDRLGVFDAQKFKFDRQTGFFGGKLTSEEEIKVQQLESALQLLNSPIRVEIVGTAATEAEMAKITGFQSELGDQPEIVASKVQDLRDAVLRFHNEARSQRGLPQVDTNQLTNNNSRLKLYRSIAGEEEKASNSSISNKDLFNSGSWVPKKENQFQSSTDSMWSTIGL